MVPLETRAKVVCSYGRSAVAMSAAGVALAIGLGWCAACDAGPSLARPAVIAICGMGGGGRPF